MAKITCDGAYNTGNLPKARQAFWAIVRPGEAAEGDPVPQGGGTCASADCGRAVAIMCFGL